MEIDEEPSTGPLLFARFCQVLDHPTFRSMAPGKQLLYLQLLRWSHGNRKELVEASRLEMCAWTGLAVETIKKHQMPIIFEYEEQFQEEFNTSFQDYVEFVDSIGYKVTSIINNK